MRGVGGEVISSSRVSCMDGAARATGFSVWHQHSLPYAQP